MAIVRCELVESVEGGAEGLQGGDVSVGGTAGVDYVHTSEGVGYLVFDLVCGCRGGWQGVSSWCSVVWCGCGCECEGGDEGPVVFRSVPPSYDGRSDDGFESIGVDCVFWIEDYDYRCGRWGWI